MEPIITKSDADRLLNQIAQLEDIRDQLTRHIVALQQHYARVIGSPVVREVDNEFVRRIQLKRYVDIYLGLYERQYDRGGIQDLADKSGVSRETIKNIRNKESQQWVSLTNADKLLQAMNMTHAFGELEIYKAEPGTGKWPLAPNPPFSHFEEE